MAIDPVTGQVVLGALGGLSDSLAGGEQRKAGVHSRYMDRRDANIEDLDRRAAFERRKARSAGSRAILQQLAARLGITMPEGAFRGSQEAVPGAVSGKYMPGNAQSAFGQSYPPKPVPMPAPPAGGPGGAGGGVNDVLRAFLASRGMGVPR